MKRFLILVAAGLLLTACGGGGGGGSRVVTPMEPMQPTTPQPVGPAEAFDNAGTRTVGPSAIPDVSSLQRSNPAFGSVAQNIYTTGSAPVQDVTTTFTGDRFAVNVTRQNGSSFTLDTNGDVAFDVVAFTPEENSVTHRPAVEGYIVGGGSGRYAAGAAFIEYSATDYTDYLAAGWWASIDLNTLTADFGAFIDGPDYDVANMSIPVMGTATYTGIGGGAYLAEAGTNTAYQTGTNEAGQYEANISLTANFANMTIGGHADNVVLYNTAFVLPDGTADFDFGPYTTNYRVNFGNAPLNANGTFFGDVTVINPDINIAQSEGAWAGQFSSVDDANGNPRAAAGTNAAYFSTDGGTEAAFVGVWYGSTGPFE